MARRLLPWINRSKAKLAVIIILVSAFSLTLAHSLSVSVQNLPGPTTSQGGLTLQVVSATYQALGNSCYDAQVLISLNNTSTTTKTVLPRQIFLVESGSNLTLTNALNYVAANNTLPLFTVFPSVQVQFNAQFHDLCLLAVTDTAQVFLYFVNPALTVRLRII